MDRNVITVYCDVRLWSRDETDCFDYISDYEEMPSRSFVVAVITADQELLCPPDEETMTSEQSARFLEVVDLARTTLSQ